MSSMKTATVSPDGGARIGGGMGRRNDTNLKAIFAESPLFAEYTEIAVKNIGISALNGNGGPGDNVLSLGVSNGEIKDSTSYYGFSDPVNLNFTGAPDIENEVPTGGGGLPASPWVPNLSSTPNVADPTTQPAYAGDLPRRGNQVGSGLGSQVSPSDTSAGISTQTIGAYISGKSYLGSVGAYSS